VKKYLVLIKYRLSLTVALSATVGYFLYQSKPDITLLLVFLGVYLMAAGSAALNQYQERTWDSRMSRTLNRPLPAGTMFPRTALLISVIAVISGGVLLLLTGIIPLFLGLSNLLFYNLLYTKLKRVSIFALLPGGLVGAIPPIIGWTAAGGSLIHPNILFLATLIFLWQIPHFWLLLFKYGQEYEDAGFVPITKFLDEKQIRRLVFFWIVLSSLFIISFPLFQIELHLIFALILIFLNISAIFLFYYLLFRIKKNSKTRIAFIITNIFLSLILLIFILNSIISSS